MGVSGQAGDVRSHVAGAGWWESVLEDEVKRRQWTESWLKLDEVGSSVCSKMSGDLQIFVFQSRQFKAASK